MMTRKLSVLSRVSSLAVAAVLTAGAAAQSFQGTPTVASGDVVITEGAGITDVNLNSVQSVIDWVPDDNAVGNFGGINFQPSGTTATFSSSSDFAVLNRINVADPGRVVGMSGAINSLVNGNTGGSIYFYSPSGFVIGSSAVINVGSLVLTASPLAVDGNGNFLQGTTATFSQAPNPNAAVTTVAGSQINAPNQGSYVALVAPRVEHHGSINVNGAAALVGAEAATINFRAGGLFDIQVDIGTTDANGVEVDGAITGSASTGFGDNRRAYLVAVPKNTALTMLISSGADLGFDIAGAADVVGNAVVLSAGHDINCDFGCGSISSNPSAASGADANISIGNANFTSALYGRADGDVVASSVAGSLTFASDVSLRGRDLAKLEAGQGGSVTIGGGNVIGNLTMSADADGVNQGDSATAGNVTLQAFGGGTVSVTGNTSLSAIGTGGSSSTEGVASGDGTGGTILVQSTSGSDMTLSGSLNADATGRGGGIGTTNSGAAVDGGDGFGGTVNVFTSGGSSMSVAGSTSLRAEGRAGNTFECFSCVRDGGIGDGGTVNVQAHSGPDNSMAFGDVLSIYADGYGGIAQTGDGGAGLGGNINFSAADSSSVTVASDVSLQAQGIGGSATRGTGNGGLGQGGTIQAFAANDGTLGLTASLQEYVGGYGGWAEGGSGGLGQGGQGQLFTLGSAATVGGYAYIDAAGRGGDGLVQGGEGRGGTAYFSTTEGGSLSITGSATLSASGRGGSGYGADGAGGNGGDGHGGHVEAFANNGASLTFGSDLYLNADGEGGSSGDTGTSAGDGFGGDVYLQAVGGGSVDVTQALYANAEGLGGSGFFGVYSGNGTGGTITVISRDGTSSLTVAGAANLEADGYAGYSSECSSQCSAGGIGQGGDIFIASTGVLTGSTLDFQSTLDASANGWGGESAIIDSDTNVDGGEGRGGTVSLYADDGNSVTVGGDIMLEAIGNGGYDPFGLIAGDGIGGLVQITTSNSAANLLTLGGSVVLDASGNGGGSGAILNGTGGSALGGEARVNIFGGTATFGDLTLRANATGGNADGGTGGNAQSGGTRVITVGGTINVDGDLALESISTGGDGDTGGHALAIIGNNPRLTATSDARVVAGNGAITVSGFTSLDVHAAGGAGANGGAGGNAAAGFATVHGLNRDAGAGSVTLVDLLIDAEATGGAGGFGTIGNTGGNGGNGGSATGGHIAVTASAGNGHLTIGDVTVSASAFGGGGGTGGNGDSGPGGNGGTGGAAQGGFINVGTESGDPEALGINDGSASFASIVAIASATGGSGGNSNFGSVEGLVGNGGNAVGGNSVLLVRGSSVTTGLVALDASATGGDSGFDLSESFGGTGGNATTGTVGVVVTNRSGLPAQRGTLDATAVIGTATATGGNGNANGLSLSQGGNLFLVANSDATIGNLSFNVDALGLAVGYSPDSIAVINGDVAMIGTFDFDTTGQLSLFANNGTMTSDALVLTAGDFVYDTVNGPATNSGTYFANSATIITGNNFLTDANLNINGDFSLVAPGSIATGIFTTAGLLDLWGQSGSVHVERIDAGTSVSLLAGTFVDTGDIDAGGGVTITAQGGSIDIGNVNAGSDVGLLADSFINGDDIVTTGAISAETTNGDLGLNALQSGAGISLVSGANVTLTDNASAVADVSIDAVGSVTTLDITAGGFIDVAAGSLIDVGNLLAGGFISLSADTILGGNMTAGGLIDLFAGGPATIIVGDLSGNGVYATSIGDITTGAIDSTLDVDLLSFNGSITTLDVTAATDITADAAGPLTMGNLVGQSVDLSAGTGIVAGDVNATELLATTLAGDMSFGDISTLLGLTLNAQGSILAGLITTGDFVSLQAGGTIGTGAIDAVTDVTLLATGNVTSGDITAGGLIDATGASLTLGNLNANSIDLTTTVADLTVGNVTIPGNLALTTAGDLVFGNLSAFDVDLAATLSMTGGDIVSATDITATAGTTMSLGNLDAGLDVTLLAAGNLTTGNITAGGLIDATGASLTLGNLNANSIDLTTTVADLTVGNVTIPGNLALTTAGDLVFGDLSAFDVDLAATGSMTGGDIDSATDIAAVAGSDINFGDLSAGGFDGEIFQFGDVSLTAGGDIATGLIFAAGSVTADAAGSVTTLNIDAFDNVDLTAGTFISAGDVNANSVNMLAGTNIGIGDLTAFGSVTLDAGGALAFGDISGFVVDLSAGGSIDGGNIDSETDITGDAGGDIDLLALTAGGTTGEGFFVGSVALSAGGLVNTGAIDAFGSVAINAGGGITTGAIDAVDFVQLGAVAQITTGDINAGDFINIFTDGGIATGDLTGTIIDLDAFGDVTFGNVLADDFEFETDGDVTGGNIVASQHVGGETLGAVVLGDISVGPGLPPNDDFSVGIAGGTSVTVGNVSGASRVGLATAGDLNAGNIDAGDLFIALVGGDASIGSITTAADGAVYMADASMYDIGTSGGLFDFNYTLVVGLEPVPTGGSITIGGPVVTGLFQAAAGGNLTTQAITANEIDASAGGLATLNGLWQAPNVELWSNDIDIAANGGIDAGNSGLIRLVSTNATQALIGDGLTGTGYALTSAEFGRLSAGSVQIDARGDASAAIDMLIGDLSITGPLAGSTIDDPLGSVVFATGDPITEIAGGVIRVVGDVNAAGFTVTNALEFYTGRFELDAATGSVNILGSGTDLGGELYIEADRIHVASGTILDQLAADPHYAGYQDDINAPAAVQRPEGVVRAGSIIVSPTQAVLVQNTGTEDQRAGFVANFVDVIAREGAAPGSLELIVNGQLLGEAGTLFGVAVRDAVVPELDLALFTDGSMINGCLLTGLCGVIVPPEPPFPPGFTPTPGIQDEVRLVEQNLLPPPMFDNDSFIDDNDELTDEGETSPIEPPQPLFDTSGLSDKGDVDDPVSGSGNPALMETVPPTSNQEKQP
jgi:filamentous hemagglutinin family protein